MHRPVSVTLLRDTSQNAQQLSLLMGYAGIITFVYYMTGDKVQYQENAAINIIIAFPSSWLGSSGSGRGNMGHAKKGTWDDV